MKHFSFIALAVAVLLLARGAAAAPHEEEIRKILPEIQAAVLQPDIIDALRTYNTLRREISQTSIDRMEAVWQSELVSTNQPLISSVTGNPIAVRLRQIVEKTGAQDIIVIDAHGISIAQSAARTSIWLGQDPAFVKTSQSGVGAVFIEAVGSNEPAQSNQPRASFTVADPDTGKPIGTISIGFNADSL